jgi:hypothetical protein
MRERSRFVVGISVLALVALLAAAGCENKFCAGHHFRCEGFASNQCPPGCKAESRCIWDPTLPDRPTCHLLTAESECRTLTACVWQQPNTCRTRCELLPDRTACAGDGFCRWTDCTGQPSSCSSYSADQCPTSRGCERQDSFTLGLLDPASGHRPRVSQPGPAWANCAERPRNASLTVPSGSRPDIVKLVP